jgi:hypothetical protein
MPVPFNSNRFALNRVGKIHLSLTIKSSNRLTSRPLHTKGIPLPATCHLPPGHYWRCNLCPRHRRTTSLVLYSVYSVLTTNILSQWHLHSRGYSPVQSTVHHFSKNERRKKRLPVIWFACIYAGTCTHNIEVDVVGGNTRFSGHVPRGNKR